MYPAHLRRVGGSVMLAIPPAILESLNLSSDSQIELLIQEDQLVVRAAKRSQRPSLDELLAQCDVSAEFPSSDANWLSSKPIGREII